MFKRRTAFYLRDIRPREEKEEGGDSRKCLVLDFQLQPFTPEQAGELNVKTRLFGSDGEPHPNVISCALSIAVGGNQQVTFFRAPDAEMPESITLRNVKVEGKLQVRRDSETPAFAARVTLVTDGMPDPKDLLALIEGHMSQFFLTFETEQGDLLDDAEARKPALRHARGKGKRQGDELRPGVDGEFDDNGQPVAAGGTH